MGTLPAEADNLSEVSDVPSHTDEIISLDISPDGTRIVTGSRDGTARLWNVETGEQIGESLVHKADVYAARFSPAGNVLATGSDHGIRLWNPETGESLGEPVAHRGAIRGIAFTDNGETLASGCSLPGSIKLWDVVNSASLGRPLTLESGVNALMFAGDQVLAGAAGARLWTIPPPAVDEREWLKLSVEFRTGFARDERSHEMSYRRLTYDMRLARYEALIRRFGGPGDLRAVGRESHR